MFFAQERIYNNPNMGINNEKTSIRIFHAAPNAPAVDVYANGMPIASNLSYRGFTEYMNVAPGIYNIEIYAAGRRDTPVLRTAVTLPGRSIFTVAAVGQLPNISLLPIEEPKQMIPSGMTMLRFSNLSPTAPNVNVTTQDGRVLFGDVEFTETTDYIPVPPRVYRFHIRDSRTNQVLLDIPNVNLTADKYFTIYAIGLQGGQPPLQVVIPLDGPSYLNL